MKYMGHVNRGFFMAWFGLGCLIGLCISLACIVLGWPLALLSLLIGEPVKMDKETVEIIAMYQTGMLVSSIARERGQDESTIHRILVENRILGVV